MLFLDQTQVILPQWPPPCVRVGMDGAQYAFILALQERIEHFDVVSTHAAGHNESLEVVPAVENGSRFSTAIPAENELASCDNISVIKT